VVYLLLQSAPIPETIELKYGVFAQQQNTQFNVKNLVVFFWGESPDNLKSQQISVSYFPDKSDKDIIRSLSERDGRVLADDQPLPKFNQPDPDFKGNKWMTTQADGGFTINTFATPMKFPASVLP
jgi:hypothetical protein